MQLPVERTPRHHVRHVGEPDVGTARAAAFAPGSAEIWPMALAAGTVAVLLAAPYPRDAHAAREQRPRLGAKLRVSVFHGVVSDPANVSSMTRTACRQRSR